MLIQACEEHDLESCASLFLTVYSELPYNENWNLKDALAYLCRLWQIERTGCFVAYGDTELEGAVFSFSYPWHPEVVHLAWPQAQGYRSKLVTPSKRWQESWCLAGCPREIWSCELLSQNGLFHRRSVQIQLWRN